jgi:hypothetical protein
MTTAEHNKGDETGANKTQKLVAQIFQDYSAVSPIEHKHEPIVIQKFNKIYSEMNLIKNMVQEVLDELRKQNQNEQVTK